MSSGMDFSNNDNESDDDNNNNNVDANMGISHPANTCPRRLERTVDDDPSLFNGNDFRSDPPRGKCL